MRDRYSVVPTSTRLRRAWSASTWWSGVAISPAGHDKCPGPLRRVDRVRALPAARPREAAGPSRWHASGRPPRWRPPPRAPARSWRTPSSGPCSSPARRAVTSPRQRARSARSSSLRSLGRLCVAPGLLGALGRLAVPRRRAVVRGLLPRSRPLRTSSGSTPETCRRTTMGETCFRSPRARRVRSPDVLGRSGSSKVDLPWPRGSDHPRSGRVRPPARVRASVAWRVRGVGNTAMRRPPRRGRQRDPWWRQAPDSGRHGGRRL